MVGQMKLLGRWQQSLSLVLLFKVYRDGTSVSLMLPGSHEIIGFVILLYFLIEENGTNKNIQFWSVTGVTSLQII